LSALLLLSWLSREAGDSDSWWHLKTGEFIFTHHHLPVPDPFAYTTYLGRTAYAGEEITRYFNLTHEWLAQVAFYIAYTAGGLTGLILMRAACLTVFCALAELLAYRRTGSVYRGLGATFATAVVVHSFTADRPQYITYVFLALTINMLDTRRWLSLLPLLFLVWAKLPRRIHFGMAGGRSVLRRGAISPVARQADRERASAIPGGTGGYRGVGPQSQRASRV
jgi:hypothetical protein